MPSAASPGRCRAIEGGVRGPPARPTHRCAGPRRRHPGRWRGSTVALTQSHDRSRADRRSGPSRGPARGVAATRPQWRPRARPRTIEAEQVAARITARTGGKVTFELFPGSQLGAVQDVVAQVAEGAPIISNGEPSLYATYGAPGSGRPDGPLPHRLARPVADARRIRSSSRGLRDGRGRGQPAHPRPRLVRR